ncbi:hypothetical protein ACIRQQ_04770 [Streptomyces fuscichromogenes]|uniref:hypothetical protein n=1 Tax=Streptomyces fuscichromogenes TaxID=1324013 RepID=UPI00381819B7
MPPPTRTAWSTARPGSEPLRPLTELGADAWGTLGGVVHLNRIPYEEPGRQDSR